MSVLDKLIGQVLLEVRLDPENAAFRFSDANLGVFSPFAGTRPEALVGRSVTAVRQIDDEVLDLQFVGEGRLSIDLSGPGPESYSLHFANGLIVVG
jgi:hypothetical protein